MTCADPRQPERPCPWSATCSQIRQSLQQQLAHLGERCQTWEALEVKRSWGRLESREESECPF